MMLLHGDCLERLRELPDCSVDACVTDPPYGLSFMGKAWDYDVPQAEVWREVLRVLKPGGHLLAFAGTRTQHRMAVQIEDAGFEIRDLIAWVYGSGFPKSLDVSKAIDKAAGAEREVVGTAAGARNGNGQNNDYGAFGSHVDGTYNITAPATPEAQQWTGWGTALKPALEPITVARKPLVGTVAENVLRHGTGALNVDGCRVAHNEECRMMAPSQANIDNPSEKHRQAGRREAVLELKPEGRWPANLIHDGSEEPCELLGSAARFFYCAKASKADRGAENVHPTVKPTELMRYLVRLVTPPGGVVLDPFMGSGSTGKAAVLEGFRFIGIEREAEYIEIARGRIQAPEQTQGSLL
jgi:DNA modification methylase